jgi:glutamyl-tRNA reductase
VIRHLCRVAAGLDSIVPGEHEISGQVAKAFDDVTGSAGHGGVLASAAALALTAGRRVRAETGVGRHAASVGSVAVEMARERIGDLAGRSAVVIGAGAAGLSIGRALQSRGVDRLTLVGRSGERTAAAAGSVGAHAASPDQLGELLLRVDLVIAAAGADGFVVDKAMAKRVAAGRGERGPLLLIDLAVPRDVEPGIAALPGIELIGLDDVRERVVRHLTLRREEIAPAEAIIDELMGEHGGAEPEVDHVIGALRRTVEDVREREVERWLDGRNGAGAPSREEIDRFTRSLVNKLLHRPMRRLRAATTGTEDGRALLAAASELFGPVPVPGSGARRPKE